MSFFELKPDVLTPDCAGHNPSKVANVESLLAQYDQRTDELLARLEAKYKAPVFPGRSVQLKPKQSIFDKLTDSSQYTGAHKHRFDACGHGRGLAGRESVSKGYGACPPRSSQGFVGNTNTGTEMRFTDSSQFLVRR